jgi:hypothetical protein
MVKRYFWPRLDKDVRRWVSGCAPCQRRKQPRRMGFGLFNSMISEYPWQRACIDLVGPLPESDDGNVYLLTCVDTFSRWPIAIPLPNKKAITIAEALYKHLICIHGCPSELFSDQEQTLISEAISTMCSRLGIRRVMLRTMAEWMCRKIP